MIINIDEIISVSKIEEYYKILNTEIEIDLILPLTISKSNIGCESLFCQLLNSWVRKSKKDSLLIAEDFSKDKGQLIDKFLSGTSGLTIVLMTIREGIKILDKNKMDLTLELRKAALKKINETSPEIILRNKRFKKSQNSIKEFCFDHADLSENKFNRWFYQDGIEEPLPDSGFRNFYIASIESLIQEQPELKKKALESKFVEDLSGIIKELFDNTHFHARDNFSKIPLKPNIRGICIELHKGNASYFKNKVQDGDPFFRYFLNPYHFRDVKDKKAFLEISVIDSGIGYAQRSSGLLLKDINKYVEREKVLECFIKYDRTAKKRGLKRVAECLTNRLGFLMLRTGRLCLYRNFIEYRYQSGDYIVAPNYQVEAAMKSFLLWEGDDKTVSTYQETCGSLVTICLPIE